MPRGPRVLSWRVLFTSLEFLVLFLPVVLVVALQLRGQPLLRWITATSVVFYAFAGHWWFIVPMLVTTTVDYLVALGLARQTVARRRRGWLLAVSLAGNLGMLAYFKYSGLLVHTAESALVALGFEEPAPAPRRLEALLPPPTRFSTSPTLPYPIHLPPPPAPPHPPFPPPP